MKKIIKLNPKLDLEVAFGIDSIKLENVEIVPVTVMQILIYIKVLDANDYKAISRLDTNIKNKLKKEKTRYTLKYFCKFKDNESLENIAKYMLELIDFENYNGEGKLSKINISVQNNIIQLIVSNDVDKNIIEHNNIISILKDKIIRAYKRPIEVIMANNHIKAPKTKVPEVVHKTTIVDFELGKFLELEGEIFHIVEKNIVKKDGGKLKIVSFYITDNENSYVCKKFYNGDLEHGIKVNDIVEVKGTFTKDMNFDQDYYIKTSFIKKVGEISHDIIDSAETKRVELGIKTNMSEMYSNINCKKITDIMSKMGHKAFAVTDLGAVHSFPFIYNEKSDVKAILGLTAYMVDDNAKLVINPKNVVLEEETYVVFDIETTGFNPYEDKIIEIGAVKIKNLEVIDTFSCFVNPERIIPEKIKELTNISDEDVKDAQTIEKVMPEFLDFVKDTTLVAHNARFDVGFITEKCKQLDYKTNFSYIDTIEWAKLTLKDQKRFNLDALCKRFNIANDDHHRALNDAEVTAKIFILLLNRISVMNVVTLTDVNDKLQLDVSIAPVQMTTILLKSQKGLSSLYELVSKSYIEYFGSKVPRIPKSLLEKNKEELLISSSPSMGYNNSGELVSMYIRGMDKEEIEEAARFYDYIQIYPIGKYEKEIATGEISGEDYVKEMNKYFYDLGNKLNKKTVAVTDVMYMTKRESKAKKVLQMANGEFSNFKYNSNSHFRTTDEMLDEFSYLGEDIAYEVVVKNTNEIADMIEKVRPIPKGFYPPKIEGDREEVKKITYEKAHELYGEKLPKLIEERIEKELNSIINNGFAVLYLIAQKLVKKSVDNGYLVGSRGSVGSSLVAYLMGITEVNGLAPHYRCSKCKNVEIFELEKSGVDLPVKNCPNCDIEYIRDGHAIPFEVFMGFDGDKVPDIDLNFSGEFQGNIHKYTEELFGKENTFRAGTISTTAYNNAIGYVKKYYEKLAKEKVKEVSNKIYNENSNQDEVKSFEENYIKDEMKKQFPEIERLALMIEGARKTTGQHPGGMVVVPSDKSVYEFTPIQKPANDMSSDSTTTHFDYHVMDSQLVKLDILGHDDPTTLKNLEDLTGISPYNIPLTDSKVLSLFSSTEALNVTSEQIETDLGTNGIPEFGTAFVKEMLKDTLPKSFTELVRISGLSHGTDVWLNNAQYYVNQGIASLSEIISVRDDIMNYLILQGIEKKTSFKIMEFVRKGQPNKKKEQWEEYKKIMHDAGVKSWYIDSCEKIKYMFPKGHAVAYVMMAMRIAYFKVYHPLEFYTAYLNRKVSSFTMSKAIKPIDQLKARYYELKMANSKNVNDKAEVNLLEILIEMHYRNIELLPVDLYKSEAKTFVIHDGKIRLPFIAVDQLGDVVAQNIVMARQNCEFSSQEDLAKRTGVNTSVMNTLNKYGVVSHLNETDQQTLF
ncbi:PolC-type DNA polymerase III [Oceanivirga salmonicida]|uniref:PolC-type DNA polymerase III n=1 Tax=Oceanivirga salmonicida TaxID=1769291 RepID=UPI000ACC3D5F|nr:PolC-type DNA polymerase III [Oceanivirga salmonicida]